MKNKLRFLLVLLLAAALADAGRAAPVELADSAQPAVEDYGTGGGPAVWLFADADAADPALSADVDPSGVEVSAPSSRIPIAVNAASGQDTRLAVDVAGVRAQAERESWGWKEWTVCGVCIVAVAAAAVLIVDATQRGSHTSGDDSSQHVNVGVGGEGNTANIYVNSPPTTTTSTSTRNRVETLTEAP